MEALVTEVTERAQEVECACVETEWAGRWMGVEDVVTGDEIWKCSKYIPVPK